MLAQIVLAADVLLDHGQPSAAWHADSWVSSGSNVLIGVALLSIPLGVAVVAKGKRQITSSRAFLIVSTFLLLSGLAHIAKVTPFALANRTASSLLDATTAMFALMSMICLWYVIPRMLEKPGSERSGPDTNSKPTPSAPEDSAEELAKREEFSQQLQRTQLLFDNFMQNSPAVTFVKDSNGKYLYCNETFEAIFGLGRETLLGKTDESWLPADVAEKIIANDRRVLSERRRIEYVEEAPGPKGTHYWLSAKFPVSLETGETGIGGFGIDITDWRRTQDEVEHLNAELQTRVTELELLNQHLLAARDQAIEASRLKSQFVANISHEVRTPMSGVLGMSELLVDRQLDPESQEIANHIYTSAQSLLSVVNDLLDFSKLEVGKMHIAHEPLDVHVIISNVASSISAAANKKGLQISLEIAQDIPDVLYGDDHRIKQVLLNLAHNAVKFTASGYVSLKAAVQSRLEEKVFVQFTVSDTGIGIDPAIHSKLFDPFVQADGSTTRTYGGTGLGLAICKSLVQLMGGEIEFQSQKNKGSTFWFTIPLSTSAKAN